MTRSDRQEAAKQLAAIASKNRHLTFTIFTEFFKDKEDQVCQILIETGPPFDITIQVSLDILENLEMHFYKGLSTIETQIVNTTKHHLAEQMGKKANFVLTNSSQYEFQEPEVAPKKSKKPVLKLAKVDK